METNIGHIFGHIRPVHNGHFGHFVIFTSENGTENYASDQKLGPKQNCVLNFDHFLCIFGQFCASEPIFIFLESVEVGELD